MNTVRSIFVGALLLTCPAEAQEHRFEADPIVVVRENFVACDVLSQLLVGRPPGGRNKTTNILKEAILLAAETVGMPEVKRNEKGEITEVLETGSRGLVGYLDLLHPSVAVSCHNFCLLLYSDRSLRLVELAALVRLRPAPPWGSTIPIVPEHEAHRKIIREWMSLPKDKRQTEEQANWSGRLLDRFPHRRFFRRGRVRVREYRRGSAPSRGCRLVSNRADALSCRSLLR